MDAAPPTRTRAVRVLLPALLAIGLAAGCGGSDGAAAPPAATTDTITIEGFAFDPVMATARVGDTIRVRNADGAAHTLTADDGSFDTGRFSRGARSVTLAKTGSFAYHCEIHTYMKGTIQVSD